MDHERTSNGTDRTHGRPVVDRAARAFSFVDYLFRRTNRYGDIYPNDEPFGVIDGTDPDHVVVIGEATAMGYGVVTHQVGLAAQFARLLSGRTARGTRWSMVALPGNSIKAGPRLVEEMQGSLTRADFVILVAGIADTLLLRSAASWTGHLTATLDAVFADVAIDALVLVAEIPPLSKDGAISRLARLASGRQSRLLNQATRRVVEPRHRCEVVPFPADLQQELWHQELRPASYIAMYAEWAAAILRVAEASGIRSAPRF